MTDINEQNGQLNINISKVSHSNTNLDNSEKNLKISITALTNCLEKTRECIAELDTSQHQHTCDLLEKGETCEITMADQNDHKITAKELENLRMKAIESEMKIIAQLRKLFKLNLESANTYLEENGTALELYNDSER